MLGYPMGMRIDPELWPEGPDQKCTHTTLISAENWRGGMGSSQPKGWIGREVQWTLVLFYLDWDFAKIGISRIFMDFRALFGDFIYPRALEIHIFCLKSQKKREIPISGKTTWEGLRWNLFQMTRISNSLNSPARNEWRTISFPIKSNWFVPRANLWFFLQKCNRIKLHQWPYLKQHFFHIVLFTRSWSFWSEKWYLIKT